MNRRLLIAFAVLLACGVTSAQAADIKIEAGPLGVKIKTDGFQGSAPRLSYDEAKGILVLEGTADTPAVLVLIRKGQSDEVRASKIIYSLKEGTLQAESPGAIRFSKP